MLRTSVDVATPVNNLECPVSTDDKFFLRRGWQSLGHARSNRTVNSWGAISGATGDLASFLYYSALPAEIALPDVERFLQPKT